MWSQPDEPNGQILQYLIALTQSGMAIHNTTTKSNEWKPKLRLKYGEVYNVSVSTMTNIVGQPVYTTVNITNTCRLQFICTKRFKFTYDKDYSMLSLFDFKPA